MKQRAAQSRSLTRAGAVGSPAAAIAVASSPSVAIAVITDTRSSGPVFEIGGSIMVGGLFGAAIGGYLRWIGQHLVVLTVALTAGFTLNVHLKELALVWQWALLLVVVRAFALWLGRWIGARIGRAPAEVGRHAWPAFISQAGVALGMATLLAREGVAGAEWLVRSLRPRVRRLRPRCQA